MADYLTDTEEGIVAALKRLWLTKKLCYPHYENQTTHIVFDQKVSTHRHTSKKSRTLIALRS